MEPPGEEEEEEEQCLLCLEPLDETDRLVMSYCGGPCKFRPCLFCYTTLYEDSQRCPGCRQQYDRAKVVMERPAPVDSRCASVCIGGEETFARRMSDGQGGETSPPPRPITAESKHA